MFIENYADIKTGTKQKLRNQLRSIALDGFSRSLNFKITDRISRTPRIQFLYIHHIFNDEKKGLDSLIYHLARKYKFISYSEAVSRISNNTIDDTYIVFSSDDGFRNNLAGAEIFARHNISACFFINPGLIGETDPEKLRIHCSQKLELPPVEFLSEGDLERLVQLGHEIGGHTMYHTRMTEMDADTLNWDVAQTFAFVKKFVRTPVHFSFPYGRFTDFNEAARKAVFDAGFISCASAERGCHVQSDHPEPLEQICLRRDHILLNWKRRHIDYFLLKNILNAKNQSVAFPYFHG